MKKEMLINVLQPEECRIAIVEDGVLEELYVERASQESYVGNIYKGRIVNIEPSIQAAFVDFGIGRNGFLHVSDVDPVYFKHLLSKDQRDQLDAENEPGPRPAGRGGRDRGDRSERPRGRERTREPRVAEPESAITVRNEPPAARPSRAVEDVDDADDTGFGEGLDDTEDVGTETNSYAETESAPVVAERPGRPEVDSPRERPAVVAETVEDEDDEPFADGLDLDDEGPSEPQTEVEPPDRTDLADVVEAELTPIPEGDSDPKLDAASDSVTEAEAPNVAGDEEAAEKPAKPRSRSRSRKPKESAGEGEDTPDAEPKKPRARRSRKKADTEESSADSGDDSTPPDADPKVMGGPERRTSPGDDEPEIRPFFEGGSDDFDVTGPNDRFADTGDDDDSEPSGFADADDEEESSGFGPAEPDEAPAMVEPADDDEFAPPQRSFDDDRNGGGRGRGRGRKRPDGDRGDRGDRGGRGGRERTGGRSGPPSRDRGIVRPPIQEIFKRGQEVIVQVIKEGIGTKGPTLSTFISIAGRYLVLMPSLGRVGVSRKIEDPDSRRRLRDIMNAMTPPKGVGFIVRTAAIDRNEEELHNDLAYLLRLWQVVVRRIKRMPAPVEIYRESDMITRTIRDIFSNDIDTIYVDEEHAFAHASEFLQIVMPRFASRIRYFNDTEPLFHKYGIENEIAKINSKRLDLPGGGSIIIEQTEALVAIDVNSGTFRAENNAEETAFRMNMRAAKEITRQLRLRDLGGVIVNDFIDMRDEKHRRQVEDVMRDALKRDRARTKILRISQFGIVEMTRQRIQPSLKKRIFNDCPHCNSTGYVKNQETMGIEVMRLLQLAAHRATGLAEVTINVHMDVAFYLLNKKRKEMAALEEKAGMEVRVSGQQGVSPELCEIKCYDANGTEIRLFAATPTKMFSPGGRPRAIPERRFPQPLD